MIGYVCGKIISLEDYNLVLETQGIGFSIFICRPELFSIGQEKAFFIAMHWSQDNGPTLYGFSSMLEKQIFLLVTSCSGIGPKIALAILSQMQPADFLRAIQERDDKALSRVNGIGPKKAEQMAMQLHSKISKFIDSGIDLKEVDSEGLTHWKQLIHALQSLNYSRTEIDAALAHIRRGEVRSGTFDILMRQALSFLVKRV